MISNFFRRTMFLLFISLNLVSCSDDGGFLTQINIQLFDLETGLPAEGVVVSLDQIVQISGEPSTSNHTGPASYVTDASGRVKIDYFSREGTISRINIHSQVMDTARFQDIINCSFSRRVEENRINDFTFDVHPGKVNLRLDFRSFMKNSIQPGQDFLVQINALDNCIPTIGIFSASELRDSLVEFKVYEKESYRLFITSGNVVSINENFFVDTNAMERFY